MKAAAIAKPFATRGLQSLAQSCGGLFGLPVRAKTVAGEPRFDVRIVSLGNFRERSTRDESPRQQHRMTGAGTGLTYEDALVPALAEGLERYCSCVLTPTEVITASATELGGSAIDLERIARCSPTELAHPKCPLFLADPKLPIRWVQGLSLTDNRRVYIPAVMAYFAAAIDSPNERFWLPNSTGCAAYPSYEGPFCARRSK